MQKILETSTYKVQDAGQVGEQTSSVSTPQVQAGDVSNNPPTASGSTLQFPAGEVSKNSSTASISTPLHQVGEVSKNRPKRTKK